MSARRPPRIREPASTYRTPPAVAVDAAPAQAERHAKLFRNGRSQAVRLPKDFRMPGDEVLIRRDGDRVILEPLPVRTWSPGYFEGWTAGSRLERPAQPALPAARLLDG